MRKKKVAKKIQQPKPPPSIIPTEEQDIELRRNTAIKEKAGVESVFQYDLFRGVYTVRSKQWRETYLVEIRALSHRWNSCTCQDFQMNRLGTCKHIERVLQWVARGKKRAFKLAAMSPGPVYEIFIDARSERPVLRLVRPARTNPAIEKSLGAYFGADGAALGPLADTWASLVRETEKWPAARKKLVRLTRHADLWLPREQFLGELATLRRTFEADVAAGKRSDNPVNVPLYPYQKQGMKHLAFSGRAMLADEMGLGKTIQAIAATELLRQLGKVQRVLIVCPASLKAEWEEQIKQFTGLQAALIYGPRAARLSAYSESHLYAVANYEQVRGDVDDINRVLLPDLVILDEAQRIKNWPTKTAKTIKRLHSPFAFILTGTPLENRIEELYSLVEFVDPRRLGSVTAFYRQFMKMDENNQMAPQSIDLLHRSVSRVMLRRRKSDVEEMLPARSDKTYFVEMTREQRNRYADYESEVARFIAIMKRRPLSKKEQDYLQLLLACMRMVCDTPYILDAKCRDCPKLEELEDILDEVLSDAETKVIIFSEWVRMLDLVKEMLEAKNIAFAEHTGKMRQESRREHIHRFKADPLCRIFLSSDAGSTGLNLQMANVVVNLDLPWNPAKLEQRIARAWRKHQRRSVRVINLVTENSIEQSMIGKLADKAALANAVLDGAVYDESSRSESGRKAFAARLGALLGQEPERVEAAPQPEKKPVRPLKEELNARFSGAILGIEGQARTGATLVVVKPGAAVEEIKAKAREAGGRCVEVITPEIKELLLKLQGAGWITLSSHIRTEFAMEGYESLKPEKVSASSLHTDAARRRWKTVENERKAFEALAGLGLTEQAVPHLDRLLHDAGDTVKILYTGKAEPDALIPPESAGARIIADLQNLPENDTRFETARELLRQVDTLIA